MDDIKIECNKCKGTKIELMAAGHYLGKTVWLLSKCKDCGHTSNVSVTQITPNRFKEVI